MNSNGNTMMADGYPKLRLLDAQLFSELREFSPDELAVLGTADTAETLVSSLRDLGDPLSLAKALFYMLPKREAVWAACLIAKVYEARAQDVNPSKALACAQAWVRDQSEELRYRAFDYAQAEDLSTSGAWAAMAAFWSGASMSPPDQEAVPPGPYHFAIAASAGAELMVFSDATPDSAAKDCLALTENVARGETGLALFEEIVAKGDTDRTKIVSRTN